MWGIDASWIFLVVASLALIAELGQDMIRVMSRYAAQGSQAGVATAAGVSVGLVGLTLLATLGLGPILQAFESLCRPRSDRLGVKLACARRTV